MGKPKKQKQKINRTVRSINVSRFTTDKWITLATLRFD